MYLFWIVSNWPKPLSIQKMLSYHIHWWTSHSVPSDDSTMSSREHAEWSPEICCNIFNHISLAVLIWIPEVIPYRRYPWSNFPVLLNFLLNFIWNLQQKIPSIYKPNQMEDTISECPNIEWPEWTCWSGWQLQHENWKLVPAFLYISSSSFRSRYSQIFVHVFSFFPFWPLLNA